MSGSRRAAGRRYDVGGDLVVADLADLAGTAGTVGAVSVTRRDVGFCDTYIDTPHRDLQRAGISLRRRTGDVDEGWRLDLPTPDGGSTSLRRPPDVRRPFRRVLAGARRGQDVVPLATLSVRRTVHRWCADDGTVLAELTDDRVQAAAADGGGTATWREVGVEAVAGGRPAARRIDRALRATGARPLSPTPRLDRVVGPPPGFAPAGAATRAVHDYLAAQHRALVLGDVALRRDRDAVHPTRVATRRWRSTLRTLGPLFDPGRAAALDAELAWYAGVLGEVRDRQVQRARFAGALAALPPELVLGPVRTDLDHALAAEQRDHQEALRHTLDSPRYRALLDEAAAWVDAPPLVGDVRARDVTRLARRAGTRLDRRLVQALRAPGDDDLLHRARKAGKRARYAAELVAPLAPREAKVGRRRARRVQQVLGDHQDAVVAMAVLRRLGAAAGTAPGSNGFTYGLLHAAEQQRADATRAAVADLAG